mgnify:CR=1 FL=1
MIKNICMILLIFVLLGACGSQAAEREKHEEPGNRIGCQMLYVDKKVRAQEVEKFIIESQKKHRGHKAAMFFDYLPYY